MVTYGTSKCTDVVLLYFIGTIVMFLQMKILRRYSQCFGGDYWGHRFSREFSRLTLLSRPNPAISSCPMESTSTEVDGSSAGESGGENGVMCTVMERSVPPELLSWQLWQFHLLVDRNCVLKTLSPAWANTLVDSCRLSVSTIAN